MDSQGFIPVKSKSHKRRHHRTPAPHKKHQSAAAVDEGIQWGKALEAFHGPLDYSGWEEPLKPDTTNLKSWERHTRVDRLQDFIPFWRDGVYAALEGREVPKSEEFFNRIYSEEDAWGLPVDDEKVEVNPWAAQDIGWEAEFTGWVDEAEKWGPKDEAAGWVDQDDAGGWGASPDNGKHGSEETAKGRSDGEAVTALHAEDANSFVDQVARLEHASGQRKERMRQFYAMTTQQKVKKIEEMAKTLRERR